MCSGQRAVGSLLPYLATGGALGLGGSAVARAGMAGISGIAGAGQSMLDTRQRIQEVQEHLEQFPGDEQARLQLQHLQDGANLHALLSGGLSAGASLLPVPGLSGATRGVLPSVARQAAAGTAQNVAQGVVQHGLIDPVRGDASDPFATVGPDTLFGLGGSLVHAGKDALSARWGSSAKPGQPKPQAPNGAPEPGSPPQFAAPGSTLEQPAAPSQGTGTPPSASLDPRVAAIAAINGAALLQKGLHNYSDWSQVMLRQHGDAIRPHLAELWRASTGLGLVQQGMTNTWPGSTDKPGVGTVLRNAESSTAPASTAAPSGPMLPASTSAAAAVASTTSGASRSALRRDLGNEGMTQSKAIGPLEPAIKLSPNAKPLNKNNDGATKVVYEHPNDPTKVVAVLREGRHPESLDREVALLKTLRDNEIPSVEAVSTSVDGKPAMMMPRYAEGSKNIVKLVGKKIDVVGRSQYLNQKSIQDLTNIKEKLVSKKIKIDDLQFLIATDGSVVIADPMNVHLQSAPSANNIKMINLLIKQCSKNKSGPKNRQARVNEKNWLRETESSW